MQSRDANFLLIAALIPSTGDSVSMAEPAVTEPEPEDKDAEPASIAPGPAVAKT